MFQFSDFFSEDTLHTIRNQAAKNDIQNRFSKETLELIYSKEWLQVAMPIENAATAYEIALLFEALAYADGSLGWAINLGAGANMFLGYLEETTAKNLKNNQKLWLAGSGACTGKAVKTEDGFILSGHWKYASGSLYATHFTANAFLYTEEGEAIFDADKKQVFRSFLFPATEVEIIHTWDTIGLRASCSNDYKVENCFVPKEHSFDLTQKSEYVASALYRYPFDAFATTNIAVMCTGMALHFSELFVKEILSKKPLYAEKNIGENAQLQQVYQNLLQAFHKARTDFLKDIEDLWSAVEQNAKSIDNLERKLQSSAREASDKSYDLVMRLYRYCGMNTVYSNNALSKVVRDFLVATQHYAISPLLG